MNGLRNRETRRDGKERPGVETAFYFREKTNGHNPTGLFPQVGHAVVAWALCSQIPTPGENNRRGKKEGAPNDVESA